MSPWLADGERRYIVVASMRVVVHRHLDAPRAWHVTVHGRPALPTTRLESAEVESAQHEALRVVRATLLAAVAALVEAAQVQR